MIALLVLLQAAWNEGLEAGLASARDASRPLLAVWTDDESPSKALLKLLDESREAATLLAGFTLARVRGKKPASLLDLPLPMVAVLEPALLKREDLGDLSLLFSSAQGRLTLAGELGAADEALGAQIVKRGRGGSLRIGPMELKDCFDVVGGWMVQTLELKGMPLVLDPGVPGDAAIEFQAGPDHTFESILRAMARQNKLVLYPREGKIVLAPRIPSTELAWPALQTFLSARAEPDALPREERERLEKSIRELVDDDPTVREAAVKALEKAGIRARRLLRLALLDTRDADLRPRLESLLRGKATSSSP